MNFPFSIRRKSSKRLSWKLYNRVGLKFTMVTVSWSVCAPSSQHANEIQRTYRLIKRFPNALGYCKSSWENLRMFLSRLHPSPHRCCSTTATLKHKNLMMRIVKEKRRWCKSHSFTFDSPSPRDLVTHFYTVDERVQWELEQMKCINFAPPENASFFVVVANVPLRAKIPTTKTDSISS